MEPQESPNRAAATGPIDNAEFARLMAPLAAGPCHLAVAVSGGADSLALALLAAEWVRQNRRTLTALTVDHGLRPESADESRLVGSWLSAHGIAHAVLRWDGAKPASGVQAAAREARYRLLVDWCRSNAVSNLLLAHHAGDQGETFVLRLQRGSGARGLAGIAAESERDGVRLLRPLLGVPKERLRDTLRAAGQPWVEDPSNDNPRYGRVVARRNLATLAAVAPDAPSRLSAAAQARGQARNSVEEKAVRLFGQAIDLTSLRGGTIDLATLGAAEQDTVEVALASLLRTVGGQRYAPGTGPLQRLLRWLLSAQEGSRTLHRCVVHKRQGRATVCREDRNLPQVELAPGERTIWDGRFVVERPAGTDPGSIGAVGKAGWDNLRERFTIPCRREVAVTLPGLFVDRVLVAAPDLGLSTARNPLTVLPLPRQTLAFRAFAVVSGAG